MKTTIVTALIVSSALACAAACGGSGSGDDGSPAPAAAAPAPTTTDEPHPAAPKRTMGTARAMATSPDNLLYDPTFSSLGDPLAYGVYAPNGKVIVPATSPAGPAAPVLVTPGGTGDAAQVVFVGQGGEGPLEARVWIADKDGAAPDVYLASMVDGASVYQLERGAASDDRKHEGRVYHLYRAKTEAPILGGLVIVIDVSNVKEITVAAPEVLGPGGKKTLAYRPPSKRVEASPKLRAAIAAAASRVPPPVVGRPWPAGLSSLRFDSPAFSR